MAGLVGYLAGPGRGEEHIEPRVVAGDEVVELYGCGPLVAARELAGVLDGPHRRSGTIAPVAVKDRRSGERTGTRDGHVWHCSLALAPGESMEDERWAWAGRRVVELMGWEGQVRWALIRHGLSRGGNDHAHLVVDLITTDGRVVDVHRDQQRVQAACARVAVELGLQAVAGQRRHVERENHKRRARGATELLGLEAIAPPAPPLRDRRARLASALQEAVAEARSPQELGQQLRRRGVGGRLARHRGEVDGLVVWELPEPATGRRRRDRPAVERAGQLDRTLAWPRLKAQLEYNAKQAAAGERDPDLAAARETVELLADLDSAAVSDSPPVSREPGWADRDAKRPPGRRSGPKRDQDRGR